jgi:hypothetical protein
MNVTRRRSHALWLLRIAGAAVFALLVAFLCLCYLLAAAEVPSEKTAAPVSPVQALLAEIVPDEGPARPPYQPARYDLALQPEAQDKSRTLSDMICDAQAREERLQELWADAGEDRPERPTAAREADYQLLSYAFGDGELDAAVRAAEAAGPAARLRLARLLLAECRFNDAVRLLIAVADGGADATSRRALALLVRHDVDRSTLAEHLSLVPMTVDLHGYLARREKDPATKESSRRSGRRPRFDCPANSKTCGSTSSTSETRLTSPLPNWTWIRNSTGAAPRSYASSPVGAT